MSSVVSGPLYVVDVQEAIPDPPSLPRYVTVTGWLYQPSLSGGRSGLTPSTDGAPASYWIGTPALPTLPALSVQLAETPLPPPNVPELQLATPERLSLPRAAKPTGWLYQPFESGPRASETETAGGVASYLMLGDERAALTLPALSEQVPVSVTPPVSGPA